MSWWRNDDPRDDDNEAEIKASFLLAAVMIVLSAIYSVMMVGCSHSVDKVTVICDCNQSRFECVVNENDFKMEN